MSNRKHQIHAIGEFTIHENQRLCESNKRLVAAVKYLRAVMDGGTVGERVEALDITAKLLRDQEAS